MDERLLNALKTLKINQDYLEDNQQTLKSNINELLLKLENIDIYEKNQKEIEDTIKSLKVNLDNVVKDNSNQILIKEEIDKLKQKIEEVIKEQEKNNNFNLQKLMISVSADLERYSIINGEWCYNGKPLGIQAEAHDGKDGKPGKDGKDGKDGKEGKQGPSGPQGVPGKNGETPILKIGKITDSEEYGGASAKFRKDKDNENVYYLDLVLPRGPQGFMGFDAKINGKNAIEIVSGNNIAVEQKGKQLFINSLINPFELKIVSELPTENISSSTIYFTPSKNSKEKNIFDESIYMNKGTEEEPNWDWETFGSTAIDLTGYVKNTDYATEKTSGVVKMWTSTNEDGEIGLNISTEV